MTEQDTLQPRFGSVIDRALFRSTACAILQHLSVLVDALVLWLQALLAPAYSKSANMHISTWVPPLAQQAKDRIGEPCSA